MIAAVEGSLFAVPESVPEVVPEPVAAFAPDCFSVSAGVVSPPEVTGSLLDPFAGSTMTATGPELEVGFEPRFWATAE